MFYKGNPNLQNENYHRMESSYFKSGKYGYFTVGASYRVTGNGIASVVSPVDSVTSLATFDNLGYFRNYNGSLVAMLKLGSKFKLYLNHSLGYALLKNLSNNKAIRDWDFTSGGTIEYSLINNFKLSMSAYYQKAPRSLTRKYSPQFSSSYILRKEFPKSNFVLSAIFITVYSKHKSTYSTLYGESFTKLYHETRNGSNFGFSLIYKFGKMENEVKSADQIIINDDLLIKSK